MRILVFGAGPLGSLMAARLHEAGQDVTLLARGQRLADLRTYGVVLEDAVSGEREVVPVPTIDRLAPNDRYDLIMVVMRKNQALAILPLLAANTATPTVLFLMNNAAGAADLCAALGRERVLLGCPAAGWRTGGPCHAHCAGWCCAAMDDPDRRARRPDHRTHPARGGGAEQHARLPGRTASRYGGLADQPRGRGRPGALCRNLRRQYRSPAPGAHPRRADPGGARAPGGVAGAAGGRGAADAREAAAHPLDARSARGALPGQNRGPP